jgi:hypothetical protein
MILACCPYLPAFRGTIYDRDGTDLTGIATLAPELNLREVMPSEHASSQSQDLQALGRWFDGAV